MGTDARRLLRYARASMESLGIDWVNPANVGSRAYVCAYCGEGVASVLAYWSNNQRGKSWICPHCTGPTIVINDDTIIPGPAFGGSVEHVPESVNDLYEEARRCLTVNAFTSSVLASRKLLMNLAVEHGADAGKSFADYVDFLGGAGYVPPNAKVWLDRIRKTGNEATHEIAPKTREDAEQLIGFTEMLLKFMYEFPAKAQPT